MSFAHIQLAPPKVLKEMRQHPRADGGQPVGLIPGTAVVPVVQDDPPTYDSRTHTAERTEVITAGEVRRGFRVVRRTPEELIVAIKNAAGSVIESRFPAWQQRNALADIVDHLAKGNRPHPQREAQYQGLWAWVQNVRIESAVKESAAMAGDPIDLDDWPELSP